MGHEIAALRSHEYWNAMGNAHFNLFLRHRKFLPICQFHLEKALRAFTRAFAFMESMADPLLLLRYAICLFWQRESVQSNLEKADDVFRDLRAKFATFCDKDRPNLLFLHFQILCRLHMYQEAAECMKTVLNLLDALPAHALDTDNSSLRPTSKLLSSRSTTSTASISAPYDTTDYMLMLMHSQQSSGDYAQASATFSAILKARHMLEADEGSSSVLHDDQYLEIWYSLAEKCFFHEEHPLALDFYSIALNFAKDSHVLASIHFHRGLCYQAIGDDANCVTEYKRARNLNRHVAAPVAIAELHAKYTDQFAVLLQKSIKLVIDEVRVLLYDKAVKKLQRIFRRKQHQQKQNHTRSAKDSVKKPHLKRTVSSSSDKYDKRSIAGSEMTGEDEAGGDNNGSSIGTVESTALSSESQQHARFLTRQRAAQDKIRAIRSDPQFQPAAQHSPLHSPASVAATRSRKIKSMPNDSLTHSALLSPEMEHPELRRKQSMETFHKVKST
uniref:Uncharacterized protein n=1 Tax=Globisporangium ultimum (strain ATCC 200006 / CBS 805.95 / DAOM BR144) TaxID=431595 RepID=K3X9V0_GLOUD